MIARREKPVHAKITERTGVLRKAIQFEILVGLEISLGDVNCGFKCVMKDIILLVLVRYNMITEFRI